MSTPTAARSAAPVSFLTNRGIQPEPKARTSAQSTSICGIYGLKKCLKMPGKSSGKQSKVMGRGRTLRVVCVASGALRRPLPPLHVSRPSTRNSRAGLGAFRVKTRFFGACRRVGNRLKTRQKPAKCSTKHATHLRQDPAMAGAARRANPPLSILPTETTSPSLREMSKATSGLSDASSGSRRRGGRE